MKSVKQTVSTAILFAGALFFTVSGLASAHVVVSPKEATTASRETFSVSVPNESSVPVIGVRVVIPEGLQSVRPFAKAGWTASVTKTGEGENSKVTEINWTGGEVSVDLKDEFQFGAKLPANATELIWKAYETYADGKVVAWEQKPTDSEDNKPYSVTKVVSESESSRAVANAQEESKDARALAMRSLYVGVIGVVIGITGVYLATKK